MTLAKGRKLLDKLGLALINLGPVASNGAVPSYPSLRKLWNLPAGQFSHDNTTGFDEPFENAQYECRRHRCGQYFDIMHDRTKADLVMEVSVMDGSCGSRDVAWIDDQYYTAWFTYGQNSWKKLRALDVRNLTNIEFEVFKTIVDRAVTSHSNFDTWCSVHYRCTLDQVKYFVDRKSVQSKPWPFFFDYNHNSKSMVADYIAYADPVMIANAARIFTILSSFKL